jgi:ornithine cyclodeaminase
MPGRVGDTTGMKVVSTVPGHPVGIVAIFDTDGVPVGIVDGPTLTAIRTGAATGLATDVLASPLTSSLAMLGAGAMARDQIAAVRAVRDIDQVLIWSRNHERAEAVAADVGGRAVPDANEAVANADIIVTATPARSPLFDHSVLRERVHINAVGAYTGEMVEIPQETVIGSYVVVDDFDAASHEAGDLLSANRIPDIDLTELLEISRIDHHARTLFKSVGIASQDIAAARVALKNAQRMGLGIEL